jgi:hypothetical protein
MADRVVLRFRDKLGFLGQDGVASDIEDGASEVEESELGDAGFVSAQGDADQILYPEKTFSTPCLQR